MRLVHRATFVLKAEPCLRSTTSLLPATHLVGRILTRLRARDEPEQSRPWLKRLRAPNAIHMDWRGWHARVPKRLPESSACSTRWRGNGAWESQPEPNNARREQRSGIESRSSGRNRSTGTLIVMLWFASARLATCLKDARLAGWLAISFYRERPWKVLLFWLGAWLTESEQSARMSHKGFGGAIRKQRISTLQRRSILC
jgi:hypothetical protein